MKPLRVLITNWTMNGRHGSVMYVRDLAWNLFRRGQQPVVYAPELGEVAQELRRETIPVTDSLQQISMQPDVIVGNSHTDMMCALLQFPGVPGIFVCHAWENWLADPPKFPRLRRYVAVDETVRDWLVSQKGVPEERVRMIYNAVDLDRFQPRDPLPEKPQRAAVFSNYIGETLGLGIIREACRRAGIALDVIGEAGTGKSEATPEKLLGRYDLVFGKARCALEAMGTGCAVILCDYGKLGGMVTSQNWPDLRRVNFGRRAIRHKLDVEHVTAEISKYNAADAREVSKRMRMVANLDDAIVSLVELGREVIQENARVGTPGPEAEARATAEYMKQMDLFRDTLRFHDRLAKESAQTQSFREEAERLQRELTTAREQLASVQRDLALTRDQASRFAQELGEARETPAQRALSKIPGFSRKGGGAKT